MLSQTGLSKFDFLRKLSLESGATDARVIPSDRIVIEDRIVLKCKVGCPHYGKTLVCPPYTPTAEEFRRIVREYSYALFMKFKSQAETDPELTRNLVTAETDPNVSKDVRAKTQKFWATWKEEKIRILNSVVGLEKAAMSRGYPLAIALVSGNCQLCEKCNIETRICANPNLARLSEDAVGVNIKKTAQNAGMTVTFPVEKYPEHFALLLID